MDMRKDVLRTVVVFGSMNMDLSIPCDRLPRAGETVAAGPVMTNPGGKGANQAVAAARMGARTHMVAAVGADSFGDALVAALDADGIGRAHVARMAESSTGTAVVLRSAGDNRIIFSPGANRLTTPATVERAIEALVRTGEAPVGSVLITQGECARDATERAIMCAHAHGLYTVFNPAPVMDLSRDAWRAVDLVCVNETECAELTGIEPADDASCARALAALTELTGGGTPVVTLGAAGSVALIDDEFHRIPALPTDVVDTTAAGDTYLGALAAARAEGLPLYGCLMQGARASALTVAREGAQRSIPTATEVLAWLKVDDAALFADDAAPGA